MAHAPSRSAPGSRFLTERGDLKFLVLRHNVREHGLRHVGGDGDAQQRRDLQGRNGIPVSVRGIDHPPPSSSGHAPILPNVFSVPAADAGIRGAPEPVGPAPTCPPGGCRCVREAGTHVNPLGPSCSSFTSDGDAPSNTPTGGPGTRQWSSLPLPSVCSPGGPDLPAVAHFPSPEQIPTLHPRVAVAEVGVRLRVGWG